MSTDNESPWTAFPGAKPCCAWNGVRKLACTRPKGHEGDHVVGPGLARWSGEIPAPDDISDADAARSLAAVDAFLADRRAGDETYSRLFALLEDQRERPA